MSGKQALRIGLLTPELSNRHGWAHHSLSLARALQRAGVQLTLVSARNSQQPPELPPIRNLLPAITPRDRFFSARMLLSLPSVRQTLAGCDLVHATIEPYALLAAWSAGDRPAVVTGHGSYVRLPVIARGPVRFLYRRAFQRAHLICVSRYTARIAHETVDGIATTVIPNAIEAERFSQIARATFASSGHPTVLFVGAVKARKGVLELVRAMPPVRQRVPDLRCVIVGSLEAEPAYVERVRAEISRLALADCVALTGHISDEALRDWYGRADCFVLPSLNEGWKFEGYGLAHLEASAASLPVIGTTECGAEDAIVDGVTGLLVPQREIAARLPDAIIQILTDPELARRMGEAGRVRASSQTWEKVATETIALYERLLDRPGERHPT